MLQRMTQKLVEVEVAYKIGTKKGKHETNRWPTDRAYGCAALTRGWARCTW
jgi:hypothetical protein